MRLEGIGNQQSINPLGPENKPSGLKGKIMGYISSIREKFGASKNESPALEIRRSEGFEIKRTDAPEAKQEQRLSFIAKEALPAAAKQDEEESGEFRMEYTMGDKKKSATFNINDDKPTQRTETPRFTPNQTKLQEQIAAARNSAAQQAFRNAPPLAHNAPQANKHKLGEFEGTYQPPPAPPSDKTSNRKTIYGQLRSDDKIAPPPVPRPTPEQVAARDAAAAKKTTGGPDDVAPKKKAKPLPTPPQPKLGQFGGSYKAPPPPPAGVDPFKGG